MVVKFLFPFLFSFILSVGMMVFLVWVGNPKVQPSSRRRLNLRRMGGVVVILVFILLVLLNKNLVITKPIAGILIGGGLILLFGLWDDLKNLNWKWQLAFQIAIAITAILFGVRSGYITNPLGGIINLNNPFLYFFIFTFYFLLFINSLNWLDGTDGLAGGVTLASLSIIGVLSFKPEVNQPAVAILAAIAGGAVAGFLVFNFHPARILAGTSGAWFFGFLLASLSIFAGAKIATVMMVTLIPILDLVRVIWERHRSGQSIFQKDRRHLHYLLLERGFDERFIFFLYFLATLLIGILALNLKVWGKLATMGIVGVFYWLSLQGVKRKERMKNSFP